MMLDASAAGIPDEIDEGRAARPVRDLAGATRVPPLRDRPRQYLPPGQFAICADPCAVVTIVGSCVAVCLVDRVARVGGMNHYVLPYHVSGTGLRDGAVAIPRLIAGVIAVGGRKDRLQAKVSGGASVDRGREVIFHSDDGTAWVRRL